MPTYMSQLPAGASTTTFVHFAQLFRNGGKFQQFDHGALKNLAFYGSTTPPEYDLSKVTVPTMLYSGDNDGFASIKDTQYLADSLPNLIEHKTVNRDGWSHLDFITAGNAGDLVYKDLIKRLDQISGLRGTESCSDVTGD